MPGKVIPCEEADFLENDKEINGQKFVCLSFLSPTKILPQKEHFFISNFLKDFDLNFKMSMLREFLHGVVTSQQTMHDRMIEELLATCPDEAHPRIRAISQTLRPRIDPVFTRLDTLVAEKKDELRTLDVKKSWEDYMYSNSARLEEEFYKAQDFHTTVRGVKVRGIYDTKQEADVRAKALRRLDPNFHVYVGNVGFWLPWDPDAHDITNQDYLEAELNTLASKYRENEEKRDEFYEQDKQDRIKAARESAKLAKAGSAPLPGAVIGHKFSGESTFGSGAGAGAGKHHGAEADDAAEKEDRRTLTGNGIGGTDALMTEKDVLSMFEASGDLALDRKINGSGTATYGSV